MAIQHNALTGADLHEPKGITSASSGSIYVANGAGSGSWQRVVHPIQMGKLGTGSGGELPYFPMPVSGQIKMFTVIPLSSLSDFYPSLVGSITVQLRNSADTVLATVVFTRGTDPMFVPKSAPLSVSVPAGSYLYATVSGDVSPGAGAHCFISLGIEA